MSEATVMADLGALDHFTTVEEGDVWQGNIADDDSEYRTDGAFLFRLSSAVERRGTYARYGSVRRVPDDSCRRAFERCYSDGQHEWNGRVTVEKYPDGKVGVQLLSDTDGEAWVDQRYLALAQRLLQPDRVTFHHTSRPFAAVTFWRDGEPVGSVMQLRPKR